MKKGAFLRPKYQDDIDKFVNEDVAAGQEVHRSRGLGRLRKRLPRHGR